MIFVFSSASKDLYKQDVLDACCYPERHVMRFRYSERLVPEQIRYAPALLVGERVSLLLHLSAISRQTLQEGQAHQHRLLTSCFCRFGNAQLWTLGWRPAS
jgi:hypothetical protein